MRMLRLTLAALLAGALPASAAELLPADKPIPGAVDHYVDAALKKAAVKPAPRADDATLLRRLTLDLVGRVPTPAETSTFLASTDADKVTKLVDALMASPGYARHQATEFDTVLMAGAAGPRGRGASLHDYLLGAFAENRAWDQVFRDLLLPDDKDPKKKGTDAFLRQRVRDLDKLTNDVSVLFFGVNISCAQCHDHPLVTDWHQDHFYGLRSFFAGTFEAGGRLAERDAAPAPFKTAKGESRQAKFMFLTGKVVETPPGLAAEAPGKKAAPKGKAPAAPAGPPKFSARTKLVELALEEGQRDFFAKAVVNRVWHRLLGHGLVSPVDQMHSANPPSHPELLDWLARDLVANKYDLKRLTRGLLLSQAYARSSKWDGESFPRPQLYAVAKLRALTPMQLATSLRVVTAAPDALPATLKPAELDKKVEEFERSARGFAALIEQPRDDFQIGVGEALLFSNSDRVEREFLADGKDRLLGKLKELRSADEQVDVAVRNVYGRAPTADEKKALAEYLKAREGRPAEGLKQVVWALLTSAEFRFNH